jgi:hypothetical protein
MQMHVRPFWNFSRAFVTSFSDSASSADVASSSNRTFGFLINALAGISSSKKSELEKKNHRSFYILTNVDTLSFTTRYLITLFAHHRIVLLQVKEKRKENSFGHVYRTRFTN